MEWLTSFLQYVGKFLPRITYIPNYADGVLFSGLTGKVYKVNGIVFWWPIISYLCSYSSVKQSRELRHQALMSKDALPINVLVVVDYIIEDVVLCATSVFDYKEILDNICRKNIKYEIVKRSINELILEIEEIDQCIFSAVSAEMAQ